MAYGCQRCLESVQQHRYSSHSDKTCIADPNYACICLVGDIISITTEIREVRSLKDKASTRMSALQETNKGQDTHHPNGSTERAGWKVGSEF